MAGLYPWRTWAVFNERDFVLGEAVENIDELIDIGLQGGDVGSGVIAPC
jgi:hypothetical protein